jgi:hypothetical protein
MVSEGIKPLEKSQIPCPVTIGKMPFECISLESSRLLPGQDEGRKGANSVERISFISSFFYYIFYCCCRLGYIVAFTKVLTICQINHT